MMFVSVIIPFFNSENFLHRSINSVVEQTYRDWEIILIDDGSTDDSLKIAKKYRDLYPGKARVFKQKNQGCGPARNKGISEARGTYIALLDSDDEWDKKFLEKIVYAFECCPEVDVVYVNAERIDTQGNIVNKSVFDDGSSLDFRKLYVREIGNLRLIDDIKLINTAIKSTIKCGSNSVMKKEIFKQVLYNPEVFVAQDRILNISVIAAGFKYGYIDEKLITLYHHETNTSLIVGNFNKKVRFFNSIIKGYEHLRRDIDLGSEAKALVDKMLSNYYLDYATTLISERRDYFKQISLILKSICVYPKNDRLYRAVCKKLKKFTSLTFYF